MIIKENTPAKDKSFDFNKIEFPHEPFLHQREVFENIYDNDFLLESPTSSGKTDAVIYPIADQILRDLEDGITSRAFFVYPTRALLWDQFETLKELALSVDGLKVKKIDPYTSVTRLMDHFATHNIIVTTPDIFYYLFLRQHQHWKRALEMLIETVRHIVFDEVHLYDTYMLLNLEFLIRCIKKINPEVRIHCLSATIEHIRDHLKNILDFKIVSGEGYTGQVEINSLDLPTFELDSNISKSLETKGRKVIILNSAHRAEEVYNQCIMWYDDVYKVFGGRYQQETERIKNLEGFKNSDKGLLVASPIVEQGVNFKASLVIAEDPSSLFSIIQRFGRVGRGGRTGKFVILTSKYFRNEFFNQDIVIDRGEFEQLLESQNGGCYYNPPLPEVKEMMRAMIFKIYKNSKLKEIIESVIDVSYHNTLYARYEKNLPDCSFRESSPAVKLRTDNLVPIWDVLKKESWKFLKPTDDKMAIGHLNLTPEEFLSLEFSFIPLLKLVGFTSLPEMKGLDKSSLTATLEVNKVRFKANGILSKNPIKGSYKVSIPKGPTKMAYFKPQLFF